MCNFSWKKDSINHKNETQQTGLIPTMDATYFLFLFPDWHVSTYGTPFEVQTVSEEDFSQVLRKFYCTASKPLRFREEHLPQEHH